MRPRTNRKGRFPLRRTCGNIAAVGMLAAGMAPPVLSGHFSMPPLVSAPRMIVARPGQLAVSPTGDRVAATDRLNNSITIVNTSGDPLWSVGEGVALIQPTAAVFISDKELVFSQWESRVLCRVAEDNPKSIDTVIDLTDALGSKAHIVRLYRLRNQTFLVLTENPDKLVRFDSQWKQSGVLIEGGSGKGRLGHATSCAEMASGKLVVTGNSQYPVQFFDPKGKLLLTADWNNPTSAGYWLAAAVAVDLRDFVWVADASKARCRLYDQTGTLLREMSFESPAFATADMAVTSDNRLVVVGINGWLEIYDLSREP